MRTNVTTLLLLGLSLAACGSDDADGGPAAYEAGAYCVVTRADPLADADATPFGPTVEALFGPAASEHRTTLTDGDGGSTELTIRVTLADDPALLVEQRAGAYEVGWCVTEVQRRARIDYVTADGRFAESFDTVLRATDGLAVTSSAQLEAGEWAGSFAPPAEAADADRLLLLFDVGFLGDAGAGTIGLGVERNLDDAVSFQVLPVGQFSWGSVP